MKRLLYSTLFLAFFGGWSTTTKAQDVHFSQYMASPLTLNPAHTGNYTGDWRIFSNYRKQWTAIGEPFTTFDVGFDRQFHRYGHNFNAGLYYIYDEVGPLQLTSNKIYGSVSYQYRILGHQVYLGIQGGYVHKAFSTDQLTFPEQYDHSIGSFNSDLAYTGTNFGQTVSYADINAGIIWSKRFGKYKPEVGFATYHLTRPNESFFDQQSRLPVRKVMHAQVRYQHNDLLAFTPNFMMMGHAKATNLLLGSEVEYRLSQNDFGANYLYGGILWRDGMQRNSDAFVLLGGISIKHFKVGISYDVNISGLVPRTQTRGGPEISIIYISPSTIVKEKTIPCERY